MYFALVLITAGVLLIFFGAKVFFGVLFIGIGFYVLAWILKLHLRAEKRSKKAAEEIQKRLKHKLTKEDLEWLMAFVKSPVGKKILMQVEEEQVQKPVRISISIPISLALFLKPILKTSSTFIWKFLKNKHEIFEDYQQFKTVLEIFLDALDELMTYSGDFIRIESQGTFVRIGIV
ncbi:DUF2059 domain-containing protein [Pseudothermotoga thermarum]|uniref:Uncharacterized protein n=1 Tax=Pseudothermotoga thermarum DSM 5069 TaxID=688269 RepID=F7YWL7_9THEM|nr:DUF2059 domain-containing protein [Pseudothermotoga thermarum]AEH51999.1 hypothetical protein Theth_1959 [Pseudothermotoga thermarum DSM 5069]